MKNFTFKW
jgi:hypothetical protein